MKYISLLIKNNKLLQKYNEIWDKISIIIKKGFDSKPVYNQECWKTKMKSYERKNNTNFHCDKLPSF